MGTFLISLGGVAVATAAEMRNVPISQLTAYAVSARSGASARTGSEQVVPRQM
jgi:hypothetical protein